MQSLQPHDASSDHTLGHYIVHVLLSHPTWIQGHHLCIDATKHSDIMLHYSPLAFETPSRVGQYPLPQG